MCMGNTRKYAPRPTRRQFNITKDELERLVWEMPCTQIAKLYGVSDKAIEKRCKLLDVEKPPRGYWQKKLQKKKIKKK